MNKVILITGANSKLGRIVTEILAKKGNIVYAGFHSNSNYAPTHKNIRLVNLDVTDKDSCEKSINKIVSTNKRLDILINLAGVTTVKLIRESDEEEFIQILRVNAVSQLLIGKLAYNQMKKQTNGGRIINIISLSGLVSLPNFSIYSASKFAAQALGEAMHYEFAKDQIKVCNISPGAINFGKNATSQNFSHKTFRQKFPLLKFIFRMTTPENIGQKIARLIEHDENPMNIILGADAFVIFILHKCIPSFLWEKMVFYYFTKT